MQCKIEKIKIKYRILPRFGGIYAEIFYIENNGNQDYELHLASKTFRNFMFGATKKEYKKAKEWVDMHLNNIKKLN